LKLSEPTLSALSLTALLKVREGTQAELVQALRGLAQDLEQQPGCRQCLLSQDVGGGPRFLLHVAWGDPDAMTQGMASEPYRVLMGAMTTLATVELITPPLLPSRSCRAH